MSGTFETEINMFIVDGKFSNNIDNFGNINLSAHDTSNVNSHYIAMDLKNYAYDSSKIETLYDINITELLPLTEAPVSVSSIGNSAELIEENKQLKENLNLLIEKSNASSNYADSLAARQTIISLRIALGQGNTESDFSDVFPYIKL